MLNPYKPGEALRVVIDTNVLLSLWVFTDSSLAPLRHEIDTGHWVVLTNSPCLDEFRRVLGYPEFKLDDVRQANIFRDYEHTALHWTQVPESCIPLPACKDKDDQKFLELARDSRAHCLITRDKALLKLTRRKPLADHFRILHPEELLANLTDMPTPAIQNL